MKLRRLNWGQRQLTALAAIAWLGLTPAKASAQKVWGAGPDQRTCVDVAVRETHPADLEWVYWVSGGAAFAGHGPKPSIGIGAELTRGLLVFRGFPAGDYGPWLGRAELRWGPWVQASTLGSVALVEGGFKLHLGAFYHASWGTYDLRLGGGYGAWSGEREPHAAVTLAWGFRSVVGRYTVRGFCDPPARTRPLASGGVLRFFVTHRRTLDRSELRETVFGIELSPELFLPPYSWFRLFGGPP